jgi:predicted dienelactone hydrolase
LFAAGPALAVGFQTVKVPDPGHEPIEMGIWYPSDAPVPAQPNSPFRQALALDGAMAGDHLPLVVISHGKGGWLGSHADTALVLAEAGFVVVAPTHTGDNSDDESYPLLEWMVERPRHISRVLDYMLDSWSGRALIDKSRIGMFGFSAGGYTALVSIGGIPDLVAMTKRCRQDPAELVCTLPGMAGIVEKSGTTTPRWVHDRRIRGAVVAAPGVGFAFGGQALASVTVPVQLWAGSNDPNVPYVSNTAIVRRALPRAPEFHEVKGAGHFAFLPPCNPRLETALPKVWAMVCVDAAGFDRAAFHQQFNKEVVTFLAKSLAAE